MSTYRTSFGLNRRLRIFLCHSAEDKKYVRNLYSQLKADGFEPWLDDKVLPGKLWKKEIQNAVRDTDVVIVFLSNHVSRNKRFFFHEVGIVIRVAQRQPSGTIFVIPALIEKMKRIPRRLRQFEHVELYSPGAHERLLAALNQKAAEIVRRRSHPRLSPLPKPPSFTDKVLNAIKKLLPKKPDPGGRPNSGKRRESSRGPKRHH